MDTGAPAEVMSMALAKAGEAHGTKKRKHPAETTADKLKAIALSKPPSSGSLIKQVQGGRDLPPLQLLRRVVVLLLRLLSK